jgi:hypothetical protein
VKFEIYIILRPYWALGLTQPLTEISTGKIMFLGSKMWPVRGADITNISGSID